MKALRSQQPSCLPHTLQEKLEEQMSKASEQSLNYTGIIFEVGNLKTTYVKTDTKMWVHLKIKEKWLQILEHVKIHIFNSKERLQNPERQR